MPLKPKAFKINNHYITKKLNVLCHLTNFFTLELISISSIFIFPNELSNVINSSSLYDLTNVGIKTSRNLINDERNTIFEKWNEKTMY